MDSCFHARRNFLSSVISFNTVNNMALKPVSVATHAIYFVFFFLLYFRSFFEYVTQGIFLKLTLVVVEKFSSIVKCKALTAFKIKIFFLSFWAYLNIISVSFYNLFSITFMLISFLCMK